ncbi:MAG: hypothetical protein IJ033_05220 [Clostridia bacterium]|nr:hypothetical protein [Clostridia bacterium]
MNLRQIIDRAQSIIGLDESFDYDNPTETLNKLIDSAKMVYFELTSEYVPLKRKEKIMIKDGKLNYSELSENVRSVLVIRAGGAKLAFEEYPTYVEVDKHSGEVEVSYLFYPPYPNVSDELLLPPQFSLYFMALGTVAEYYYRVGMVDEALFYKTRYEHSLRNLTRNLKSVTIPRRVFIW